eukprot:4586734-Amphidinium_carterae.1
MSTAQGRNGQTKHCCHTKRTVASFCPLQQWLLMAPARLRHHSTFCMRSTTGFACTSTVLNESPCFARWSCRVEAHGRPIRDTMHETTLSKVAKHTPTSRRKGRGACHLSFHLSCPASQVTCQLRSRTCTTTEASTRPSSPRRSSTAVHIQRDERSLLSKFLVCVAQS